MDITLAIVGLIMGIIGLLGVIIPVLPGTILSYIGLLSVYFISGNSISTLQLVICGIASVVVVVLDYILPGYFSKMFGGTKVASVNVINMKRKPKRMGVHFGYTSAWKKAIVTLTADSKTIEFFEGLN